MDIIISNSSNSPIYDQIYSQIKAMILNGTLKEGDSLPSMRLLAKELRISVITTKRAYEELERDGFIETVTGKGSFVGKNNVEFIKEEHQRMVEDYLTKAIDLSKQCDLTLEDLTGILELLYKGE
ncbi:GntR family transcriptional regulator [Anaeromicropila herbilytica]|uniref:GntR family transcriptional regulator n=1 Tax=Anaeromicropila herbilytica TaxID=2785025 RepID=A0A7R7IBJ4_9FIRM|nr:GntR family transcriptional regulator [Anaeromicropila herbilytica]BCN28864.1 GntR family transcriptional regulator [Anaeromicropila herbilytica]